MKKKIALMGIVFVLILAIAVPALATNGWVQKSLEYRNIKITMDGKSLTPTDANGNAVEPFIIDGTTYLPVRAVANALDLDVGWDDATSTVSLKHKTPAVAVTALSLDKTTLALAPGKTATLTAKITPTNATDKSVTWKSSNTSVASVSSSGVVTANKEGSAIITATTSNGLNATCSVTVSGIIINLKTALPFDCNYYTYSGKIDSSCLITDFSYEATYHSYDDDYTTYIYFTGEKTYDQNGSGQSSSCKIGWKLYDEEGYVVDSGTVYSDALATGEKFRNAKDYIFDMKAGVYTLVLSNVN